MLYEWELMFLKSWFVVDAGRRKFSSTIFIWNPLFNSWVSSTLGTHKSSKLTI
jgi:hypothetical protein